MFVDSVSYARGAALIGNLPESLARSATSRLSLSKSRAHVSKRKDNPIKSRGKAGRPPVGWKAIIRRHQLARSAHGRGMPSCMSSHLLNKCFPVHHQETRYNAGIQEHTGIRVVPPLLQMDGTCRAVQQQALTRGCYEPRDSIASRCKCFCLDNALLGTQGVQCLECSACLQHKEARAPENQDERIAAEMLLQLGRKRMM
jgi:hypothetical protein